MGGASTRGNPNGKVKSMSGRYGRLVVTGFSRVIQGLGAIWLCDCDCGTKDHEARGYALRIGSVRSCGCINYKHGESSAGGARIATTEYTAWRTVKTSGIPFVERWGQYANFLTDMGRRPPKTWLRRHDEYQPHGPGNSFWGPRGGRRKRTI